jgi:hypothetical protein
VTTDELPPVERTPGGNDLSLLREMLALTPEERIARNVEWLRMVEELRAGLEGGGDGPEPDLPGRR